MQPNNQASPACRVYLHPSVTGNQSAINAIVARTGLAVVVGTNRAALSLVEKPSTSKPITLRLPRGFERMLDDAIARIQTRALLNQPDPGNGGWIGDDHDPFNGGGRAA